MAADQGHEGLLVAGTQLPEELGVALHRPNNKQARS